MSTSFGRADHTPVEIRTLVADIVTAVRDGNDEEITRLDALLRAEEDRIKRDPRFGYGWRSRRESVPVSPPPA